jgi:glycine cleavage system H protein
METDEYFELTIDKFKLKVPKSFWYAKSDTWVKIEGNIATVGITDFLQTKLGDILFFSDAEAHEFKQGDVFGTIESIKATVEINIPVSGKLISFNEKLQEHSNLLSQDAYGEGWIAKIELSDWVMDQFNLLSPEDYFALITEKSKDALSG